MDNKKHGDDLRSSVSSNPMLSYAQANFSNEITSTDVPSFFTCTIVMTLSSPNNKTPSGNVKMSSISSVLYMTLLEPKKCLDF